jgi:hypothetical protein
VLSYGGSYNEFWHISIEIPGFDPNAWPHMQAWLSWSERGPVVGSIPSRPHKLNFPWFWILQTLNQGY